MEIGFIKTGISNFVFKEERPFISKRDVNWPNLSKLGALLVSALIVLLLLMPTPEVEQKKFHEKVGSGNISKPAAFDSESDLDSLYPQNHSPLALASEMNSVGYSSESGSFGGIGGPQREVNGSMILSRGGLDTKNQLPPGARIPVSLTQKSIVSNQAMPIMATVTKDITHEDSLAIPEGSKVLGEISFDDSSDRAQVSWRSIQFEDGRERPLSGMALSQDGQLGITGTIHSDGFKNTTGQLVARFIGAYAEGSMQKGALGASPGGTENGLKSAVSETAKDRGEAWAEDMKKQKRWIEVNTDQNFLLILNQPFTFRDPGSVYGK